MGRRGGRWASEMGAEGFSQTAQRVPELAALADDRRGGPDASPEARSVTLLRRDICPSLEARGSRSTLQGSCSSLSGGVHRRAFPTAATPTRHKRQ